MASKWQDTTLAEVVEFGAGHRNSQDSVAHGQYPFFTCSREVLRHSEFDFDTEAVIMAGNNADARFHLQYFNGKFAARQRTYIITPKSPQLNCLFLFYALHGLQPLFAAQAQGTTTKFVTIGILRNAPISLPPLSEQRAIAHILGTLDDKIELNRRMNETLESIARALFQSWFVDFDPVRAKAEGRDPGLPKPIADLFPDSFEESELGEIPKGWRVASLGDLCQRVSMGPFGSDIKTDNFVDAGVPVIRGGNLTDGFVDSRFVFVSEAKADELRNANAFPSDIVITHRGTLGQVGLIPKRSRFPRYVVSQSQMLLSVHPDSATPLYVFEYLRSSSGRHALLANTSQTGVPAISRPTTSLKAIRLLQPPLPILASAEQLVGSAMERCIRSTEESASLATLRDTLLPRLISGELRVSGR